jgi:hypothetical protein
VIQYNLARLKSAPANRAYLDGFERMRCTFVHEDGQRCKRWKVENSDFCAVHVKVWTVTKVDRKRGKITVQELPR